MLTSLGKKIKNLTPPLSDFLSLNQILFAERNVKGELQSFWVSVKVAQRSFVSLTWARSSAAETGALLLYREPH